MGSHAVLVCSRHGGEVRMNLRTLHSEQSAPLQVIGVYVCPECGHERRLPITSADSVQLDRAAERAARKGAA